MTEPTTNSSPWHRALTWSRENWKYLAGAALVLTCGLLAVINPKDNSKADGIAARNQCQRFVEDRLKAPSTAEFSNVTYTGAHPRWTVTGSVDAANSFGAMLRMNWTCVIRLDGDTWYLESLTGLK